MRRYVLLHPGVDYNDETYTVGGEGAKVLEKSYATKEEAQAAIKNELIALLRSHHLHDFLNYTSPLPLMKAFAEDVYDTDDLGWDEGSWEEFIDWCEANNLRWMSEAPELLQIFEIEV